MRIFNSLSKKAEEFVPIDESKVTIYSCGPTVYDNLHIGNLSAFIYADLLRRTLSIKYPDIIHVMNITDVDDKTIRDSKVAYPDLEPIKALKKLTDKFTKVFKADLKATGNDVSALTFISAVDTIAEMIMLTQKLLDEDIAYIADDGVYFSITKYYQSGHKYGVLQNVETQQSKQRIINDEYDKECASDFALWKKAESGEPSWDAEFTEDSMTTVMAGRPGWHIECSAMSEKLLGVPFDIHTGGIDLKFPHHENEIAQTCGASADNLANYFVHNNHLLVDGKKMSKSLKNFYTLRDIEEKGYSAQAFRLLTLESHYHSESNFSWDILTAAKNRLRNWLESSEMQWQLPEWDYDISADIAKAIQDNMNTPLALKYIDEYFDKAAKQNLSPNKSTLQNINNYLGIDLSTKDITKTAKTLLSQRKKAKDSRDYAKSDLVRDKLLAQGIAIRDSSNGQIWYRV